MAKVPSTACLKAKARRALLSSSKLWRVAVQAGLSDNLTERRQARIASGALLAGVIFDDRGHRMSPTYTVPMVID
jgi:hypothetical protein